MSTACQKPKHRRATLKGQHGPLDFFEELIWDYHQGNEPCMFLPSLKELSSDLACSSLEVQCALNALRKEGYDYFMIGIDAPITVWYPQKLKQTNATTYPKALQE